MSDRKISISYLFFGLFFTILTFVHCYHVHLIEEGNFAFKWFFSLYATGQLLLESVFLIFLMHLVKTYLHKSFTIAFSIGIFLLFLAHLIDFPLVRMMDITFWYGIDFIKQESFENFLELLASTHIPLKKWMLGGGVVCLMLLLGSLFYRYSEKIAEKRSLYISQSSCLLLFIILPLLLFGSDQLVSQLLSSTQYGEYQKTLPWKEPFSLAKQDHISIEHSLKKPMEEQQLLSLMGQASLPEKKLPDIYLFVAESLREDYLTSEIAPQLYRFKNNGFSSQLSLSNANGTQVSWFSLFYSQWPLYFQKINHKNWQSGSPPLQILKKLGYQIEIFSSVHLAYYNMLDTIFGKNGKLADRMYLFPHDDENNPPYLSDQQTMTSLVDTMRNDKPRAPTCSIIFLESTHFDYSWPKETLTKFQPISNQIDYLSILLSKADLYKVKNRYRNAIFYIDTLFGKFLNEIEKTPRGKESVIVFTGDHGEEFYEKGHLFHASHLSCVQTQVPIYYRFPEWSVNAPAIASSMSTHMDVFPTIFHYLFENTETLKECFQGESIFHSQKWPYAIVGRFNASRTPFEFFIHNGTKKLLLRFKNKKNIFEADTLQILSLKDLNDENINESKEAMHAEFQSAFQALFSP